METTTSNAIPELFEAYEKWRDLTWAEGEAIQACNWPLVANCQHAKKLLQTAIIQVFERAQIEWQSQGKNLGELHRQIRRITQDLVILENRNGELLAAQLQMARHRQKELTNSSRNLVRVRQSYAPAQGAVWHSYS